jgi:hypothetical protein
MLQINAKQLIDFTNKSNSLIKEIGEFIILSKDKINNSELMPNKSEELSHKTLSLIYTYKALNNKNPGLENKNMEAKNSVYMLDYFMDFIHKNIDGYNQEDNEKNTDGINFSKMIILRAVKGLEFNLLVLENFLIDLKGQYIQGQDEILSMDIIEQSEYVLSNM